MIITRTQALAMAIGLALLGVAMAKAGGSELRNGLIALPTKMEPKALARGDIVLVDPAERPSSGPGAPKLSG
jgi:hypothetical protein